MIVWHRPGRVRPARTDMEQRSSNDVLTARYTRERRGSKPPAHTATGANRTVRHGDLLQEVCATSGDTNLDPRPDLRQASDAALRLRPARIESRPGFPITTDATPPAHPCAALRSGKGRSLWSLMQIAPPSTINPSSRARPPSQRPQANNRFVRDSVIAMRRLVLVAVMAACSGPSTMTNDASPADASVQDSVDASVIDFGVRVAVGNSLGCKIRADRSLWCWGGVPGSNINAASPSQVGTDHWNAVAVGGGNICAIRDDRTLWCWGGNSVGQVGDGTMIYRPQPVQISSSSSPWETVDVGDDHSCAITSSGELWCWGRNLGGILGDGTTTDSNVPVRIGQGTTWSRVALGTLHSCAISAGRELWCWGSNQFGQFGDLSAAGSLVPVKVSSALWKSVDTQLLSTCAIRDDDALLCAGRNNLGQLGIGTADAVPHGFTALPAAPWVSVVVGLAATCAIRNDRSLWCWGSGRHGLLGQGDVTDHASPVQVAGSWDEVALGMTDVVCARSDDSYACWGWNNNSALGIGRFVDKPVPVQISTAAWTAVEAGEDTCAIRSDGSLWCWGGDEEDHPTQVGSATTWTQLSSFGKHTCGLQSSGGLWCWGSNGHGQLGDGTTTSTTLPVRVGTATWTSVGAGSHHTCGIQTDGSFWCWGSNARFVLGTETVASSSSPLRVGLDSDWVSVTAGYEHTCGTRSNGTAWCWGSNSSYQLGVGSLPSGSSTPLRVGTYNTWSRILAGQYHTCGLHSDGRLGCWGSNGGTGPIGMQPDVLLGGTWSSFTVGTQCTCALRTDGTRWCWGAGAFGDGFTTSQAADPMQIGTSTDWAQVSAGYGHACALRAGNTLWCWGVNLYGAVGAGDAWFETPTFHQ